MSVDLLNHLSSILHSIFIANVHHIQRSKSTIPICSKAVFWNFYQTLFCQSHKLIPIVIMNQIAYNTNGRYVMVAFIIWSSVMWTHIIVFGTKITCWTFTFLNWAIFIQTKQLFSFSPTEGAVLSCIVKTISAIPTSDNSA